MTQVWNEKERVVPVTTVVCKPARIKKVKTQEKDGYSSIVIESNGVIKEFRITKDREASFKEGEVLDLASIKQGDRCDIIGKSKGRGFQGVVKRHNFRGRKRTHGVKHDQRKGGSMGCGFPEHVIKGKKMAGRMGGNKITLKKVFVVSANKESEVISFKGAIPGRNGSLVFIEKI